MHSIVTTFRGAVIKVEVANFCVAMDTLIDQDAYKQALAVCEIRKWTYQPCVIQNVYTETLFNLITGAFKYSSQ